MCVDERHGDELFCRFLVSLTVLIALQDIYQKRKHKKADLKVSTFHSGPGLDCTALCEAKKNQFTLSCFSHSLCTAIPKRR